MIHADRTELTQVFSNLVSNALKFSDSGTIRIQAKRNDNRVVVKVADQGQGIPAEDLRFIFDEFYQVQHAPSRKRPQGIGLGLPIAKKLVESYHGSIRVTSRVGRGSTFTVILPLAKRPDAVVGVKTETNSRF